MCSYFSNCYVTYLQISSLTLNFYTDQSSSSWPTGARFLFGWLIIYQKYISALISYMATATVVHLHKAFM
jgi:hypothetical protein